MSRNRMLQRIAILGIGGVAAGLTVLTPVAGIASAKPDQCKIMGGCMPDIPPDEPNHPGPTPFPPDQSSYPDPGDFPSGFACQPRHVFCPGD
jgi:hypothetical protein